MEDFTDRVWYGLAVAVYGVAAGHGLARWRQGSRRNGWIGYGGLAGGFVLHSVALLARGFSMQRCPVTNLFEALMFLSWAIAGAYLVLGLWTRLRFMSHFLAPGLLVTGLLALQPSLDTPGPDFDLERWALSLHVVFILLGYAAFGLAALAAALFLARAPAATSDSVADDSVAGSPPAASDLEQAVLRSLGIGLLLLTAGLAISFALMRERYGVVVRPDPKIAWSALVWTLYLGMLAARLRFGRSARSLAWGALGGFAFVLLTFWGTNLLSPIHHP